MSVNLALFGFLAFVFPPALAPPAPFPLVVAQSSATEFVAPGVRRAEYHLMTSSGPLAIDAIAVDLHEPTVRLDDVLAGDHLVSPGETISSMARRTHAVAGVNADYFDIGQTNQPLNLVVREGRIIRTPSRRSVLLVGPDKSVRFGNVRFTGTVQEGAAQVPLTTVNEWPPQGGASLLTPDFGTITPSSSVIVATLAPVGPLAMLDGDYRVVESGSARGGPVTAPTLAFGPAALARAPAPAPGDTVTIAMQTDPPLDTIAGAVGGGPLLLAGGAAVDDPNAPAPEERDRRFPVSGGAATPDGTLLLLSVDGRQPQLSIGVTRPEFAALMQSFGASDGMAFDSGGSATLVARVLGEAEPRVLNTPSDGVERPVADGLFVYSDAPVGPPSQLIARPARIAALAGARITVRASIVDAAGHYLGAAPPTTVVARTTSTTPIVSGPLEADVPITVVDRIEKLVISPVPHNPDAGGIVHLQAEASDADGAPIAVEGAVRWNVDRGTLVSPGVLRAPSRDVTIVAHAANLTASATLLVGRHVERMRWFDPSGTLSLSYALDRAHRASYANTAFVLPGEPLGFSVDVDGDASGLGLRVAFINRFGERRALTLARRLDWSGWRRCDIKLPPDLNPPVTLASLYVYSAVTPQAALTGTIRFREPSIVVAGTP